jgi:lambda family phage minor tail protein L
MTDPTIYRLSQPALISLFELDLNPVGFNLVLRFCNEQDTAGDISWNGNSYTKYPIDAKGLERSLNGGLPTSELRVSNVSGVASTLIRNYKDLCGAKMTRYKIWEFNLDGRPGRNGAAIEETQVWYLTRYDDNDLVVTFQLKHPIEISNRKFPARRMAQIL